MFSCARKVSVCSAAVARSAWCRSQASAADWRLVSSAAACSRAAWNWRSVVSCSRRRPATFAARSFASRSSVTRLALERGQLNLAGLELPARVGQRGGGGLRTRRRRRRGRAVASSISFFPAATSRSSARICVCRWSTPCRADSPPACRRAGSRRGRGVRPRAWRRCRSGCARRSSRAASRVSTITPPASRRSSSGATVAGDLTTSRARVSPPSSRAGRFRAGGRQACPAWRAWRGRPSCRWRGYSSSASATSASRSRIVCR